jgi:hypothetical protein
MEMHSWVAGLVDQLPAHAETLDRLARAVASTDRWRSLLVGCSLSAGRGDQDSDIDAGIAYATPLSVDELEAAGRDLVAGAGDVIDVLVHTYPGWPDGGRRFAIEYANGIQLDLAAFPAPWRRTRGSDVAIVDKDGDLAELVVPPPRLLIERRQHDAREWVMLGWWSVSNIAKYVRRDSLYEAAASIDDVRGHCCSLYAVARGVPDPEYGLTSLLDVAPAELPDGIARTYCRPDDRATVVVAAQAVTHLLAECAAAASATLGIDLDTRWSDVARSRLSAVLTSDNSRRGSRPPSNGA